MIKKRVLLGILLLPIITIFIWYSISFLPYLDTIKQHVKAGQQEASSIHTSLYPLAIAAETKEGIKVYTIQQAYRTLALKGSSQRVAYWHLNNMLWYAASSIHLTERDMFYLWINCSYKGCGIGLPKASELRYNKALGKLTIQEQAEIVAMVKAPSRFKVNSTKLKERAEKILKKVQAKQ